jgi:hypothetical protein
MPLRWTIDSQRRLFTAIAEGFVNRSEADACLDAVVGSGALAYRKLFDGSQGDITMTPDDLLHVGVRIREFHTLGPMGPLAFVLPVGRGERLARVLGVLATADRPMRIFHAVGKARRWLESVSPAG